MVLIKVQYDAYNRQFKLCDPQLAKTLTDGETYLLLADLSVDDPALTENVQNSAETPTRHRLREEIKEGVTYGDRTTKMVR